MLACNDAHRHYCCVNADGKRTLGRPPRLNGADDVMEEVCTQVLGWELFSLTKVKMVDVYYGDGGGEM